MLSPRGCPVVGALPGRNSQLVPLGRRRSNARALSLASIALRLAPSSPRTFDTPSLTPFAGGEDLGRGLWEGLPPRR